MTRNSLYPALRAALVFCCILALLLLTACGPNAAAPEQAAPEQAAPEQPAPEQPAPEQTAPEQTAPPATPGQGAGDTDEPNGSDDTKLLYWTDEVYDAATGIRRTTLNPQGYNLSVYLETPVFAEDTEANRSINAFFEDLTARFFSAENENLATIWESTVEMRPGPDSPIGEGFAYENDARITTRTQRLVSVTISYMWYAGGVADNGGDSYVFNAETGQRLGLTDITKMPEDDIRAAILSGLEAQNDQDAIDPSLIAEYSLEDFDFHIEDGKIWIDFDKYEAAQGAYGAFSIELPAELDQ